MAPTVLPLAWLSLWLLEISGLLWDGPRLGQVGGLDIAWASLFLAGVPGLLSLPADYLIRRPTGRWMGTAALTIAVLWLNGEAFSRGFWHVPMGAAGFLVFVTWLSNRRWKWARLGFGLLGLPIAAAMAAGNRFTYPDRYLFQHITLTLLTVWLLTFWWNTLLSTRRIGLRAALGIGSTVILLAGVTSFLAFGLGRIDLGAASVVTRDLPTPRSAHALLMSWNDRDGDGFGTLLVRSDCDDTNPEVNPKRAEIPGNGLDDNCLGGDAIPRNDAGNRFEPGPAEFRKILLVTIDSLRADRLYGPRAKAVAPLLQDFAKGCRRYTRAYATYGSTMFSVFSLFRSVYPSQAEGMRPCGHFFAPFSGTPSMTGLLRDAGFRTVAVLGTWVLGEKCGLSEGFDERVVDGVELYDPTPRADWVTDRALEQLGRLGTEPWFFWVHYYDPHEPYFDGFAELADGDSPVTQERRYEAEIRFVDRHLARLLERVGDDVLVLVTADHGERFQHGRSTGHIGLHQDALHVPLLLCGRQKVTPGTVDRPVSLLDVAPTILDQAGLRIPGGYGGQALLKRKRNDSREDWRGWAGAEFFRDRPDPVLRRAVFGDDFSVLGDHVLATYRLTRNDDVLVSSTLERGDRAADAYLQFVEDFLASGR